ncbi:hypothetical protein ABT160_02625 [Streptomyces sp. NPDC001941]|uniref:hypothetical protein n=1 Tax=Streptomyces sp. NPDC001941 TaxID=3154659 RepID=UPI00331936B7
MDTALATPPAPPTPAADRVPLAQLAAETARDRRPEPDREQPLAAAAFQSAL